jgi:hypothetical protein
MRMAEAVLLLLAVREAGDERLFTLPALTLRASAMTTRGR